MGCDFSPHLCYKTGGVAINVSYPYRFGPLLGAGGGTTAPPD